MIYIYIDAYMSSGIDLCTGSQQPSDDVIVAHLRCDPQWCGTVCPRCVRLCSMIQKDFQDTKMAVLRGDEQRRSAILRNYNRVLTCFLYLLISLRYL